MARQAPGARQAAHTDGVGHAPTIFGIRHHGPGSARSLRAALEALRPDAILVEGPPDAAEVLPLLTHPDMRPPVALLIYVPDRSKLPGVSTQGGSPLPGQTPTPSSTPFGPSPSPS